MRILLACEESQAVCEQFIIRGHDAYSCDLLPSSHNDPEIRERHIQSSIIELLENDQKWDLLIAFPPCTHLAVSGARHFKQKQEDGRQKSGIDFFMYFTKIEFIDKIAIENPIGIMSSIYKKPSQIIQPYQFGDPYSKSTCLWLKNLPTLQFNAKNTLPFPDYQNEVDKGDFITFSSGKRMAKWYNDASGKSAGHLRSKTFPGIAKAMAEQWG